MTQETVKITIDKKSGAMTFDLNGFIGNGCDIITQIENQIGQTTKTEDKAERWQWEIPNNEFNFA